VQHNALQLQPTQGQQQQQQEQQITAFTESNSSSSDAPTGTAVQQEDPPPARRKRRRVRKHTTAKQQPAAEAPTAAAPAPAAAAAPSPAAAVDVYHPVLQLRQLLSSCSTWQQLQQQLRPDSSSSSSSSGNAQPATLRAVAAAAARLVRQQAISAAADLATQQLHSRDSTTDGSSRLVQGAAKNKPLQLVQQEGPVSVLYGTSSSSNRQQQQQDAAQLWSWFHSQLLLPAVSQHQQLDVVTASVLLQAVAAMGWKRSNVGRLTAAAGDSTANNAATQQLNSTCRALTVMGLAAAAGGLQQQQQQVGSSSSSSSSSSGEKDAWAPLEMRLAAAAGGLQQQQQQQEDGSCSSSSSERVAQAVVLTCPPAAVVNLVTTAAALGVSLKSSSRGSWGVPIEQQDIPVLAALYIPVLAAALSGSSSSSRLGYPLAMKLLSSWVMSGSAVPQELVQALAKCIQVGAVVMEVCSVMLHC
jgi:hypothetical protein